MEGMAELVVRQRPSMSAGLVTKGECVQVLGAY